MTETKRGPGRPRKATPHKTKEGHSARVWVEREGEKVRVSVKLGTQSRVVARARAKRVLAKSGCELFAEKSESFESAARRVLELSVVRDKKKMLGRLENHAFPIIGAVPVSELTSVHVLDVLEEVAGKVGGWTGSVRNVRDAISKVLGALVERRVLDVNEALRVKMRGKDTLGGRRLRKVRPPRAVLTDEEFGGLIAFLAEESRHRFESRARRALGKLALYLSARVLGMRASDAWAWRWEMIDLEAGDAYVPSQKTDGALLDELDDSDGGEETVVLESWRDEPRRALPEVLGGWLGLWWRASSSPREGLVFPVSKGRRAGQQKKAGAHALALRALLWRAGVVRARPGADEVKTPADCVLQTGVARRLSPVDFHSFRRAAATAAGRAVATKELSLRAAMALTHHSDPAVFAKYQAREERIVLPESAVPAVVAAPMAINPEVECETQPKTAAGEENAMEGKSGQPSLTSNRTVVSSRFLTRDGVPNDVAGPPGTRQCQNSLPLFEGLDEVLEYAVQLAMKEGDFDAVGALVEVAKRRRAAAPDNVSSLDSRRRKS